MFLAHCQATYPDELRADFQQFYNLNIDDIGHGFSFHHAGVLLAQMPRASRVISSINPKAGWTDEMYLLSSIEYSLRVLAWQNTEDARKKRNKPHPPIQPEEKRTITEPLATQEQMEMVALSLGISLD